MEIILFIVVIVLVVWLGRLSGRLDSLEVRVRQQQLTIDALKASGTDSQQAQTETAVLRPSSHSNKKPGSTVPDTSGRVTNTPPTSSQLNSALVSIWAHLHSHWLLWVGGISLAIGGLFLARYAIDAGVLSAGVRVLLIGGFGCALVALAVYLDRHRERFAVRSPLVTAAIASGGVITCYAILLVAHATYNFIGPESTFLLLAIVSLFTTWLTLRLGIMLAVVGLVGAYLVPALIQTETPSAWVLIGYLQLVTLSVVYIAQRVEQQNLCRLALAFHGLWLLFTAVSVDQYQVVPILAGVIGLLYAFTLIPVLGWRLRRRHSDPVTVKGWFAFTTVSAGWLVASGVMVVFVILATQAWIIGLITAVFSIVLCLSACRHSRLDGLPFVAAGVTAVGVVSLFGLSDYRSPVNMFASPSVYTQLAVLCYGLFGVVMARRYPERMGYAVLPVIAIPLLLALPFSIRNNLDSLVPLYSVELGIYALISATALMRVSNANQKLCSNLLMHGCITLLFSLYLTDNSLTVALSLQVTSLLSSARRLAVSVPDWIVKLAVGAIVLRLTIAPFDINTATNNALGDFWIFVTYPLVLIAFAIGYRFAPAALQKWLVGAQLHVGALLLSTATCLFLTGSVLSWPLRLPTAILLSANWLVLAGVYLWRAQSAGSASSLYKIYGGLLTGIALAFQFGLLIMHNPFLSLGVLPISNTALWLVLLWLVPGALIAVISRYAKAVSLLRRSLLVIASAFSILFINGAIRLCYQKNDIALSLPTGQTELYTYSAVWLIIAALFLVAGYQRRHVIISRVGLTLLLAVICKVFLIDTGQLEGLLRALSFLGLGGSLVALGWLFQRINAAATSSSPTSG